MIVSHRHRFVFFAVPRTGTHAVREALQPLLGEEDWQQEALRQRVFSPIPALAQIGHGHITVRQAWSSLPAAVWRAYFKFALVRNPFDRYVSICAMLNKRNPRYVGNERAFMKGALDRPWFRRLMLVRSQAAMLTDERGQLAVDFIGRYEDLDLCFAEICRRIGLAAPTLAVRNATAHRHYAAYYDDELVARVAEFYDRDFALFEYSSRLPGLPATAPSAASCA